MEKYTKKASARIMKEVLKIEPKASKLTTYDQAFVILTTHWGLELSVGTDINYVTTCTLHRGDETPKTWVIENIFDPKVGNWDWSQLYKIVLEDVIKLKLYKKPKLGKRALAQKEKEKIEKEKIIKERQEKEQARIIEEEKKINDKVILEELRKRRCNLSAKIHNYKKKGQDITNLESELNNIKSQIKILTKTA